MPVLLLFNWWETDVLRAEELPRETLLHAAVTSRTRSTNVYIRLKDDEPHWHTKASCVLPVQIWECSASGSEQGFLKDGTAAWAVKHEMRFPELNMERPELRHLEDVSLLTALSELCGTLVANSTGNSTGNRQRHRRCMKAGQNLSGILAKRREESRPFNLLDVGPGSTFLAAAADFLGDMPVEFEVPELGTWFTRGVAEFSAWLKPGIQTGARQALLMILKQLQQKVHYTVQCGRAYGLRRAIVRTQEYMRSDKQIISRLLVLDATANATFVKHSYIWVCEKTKLGRLLEGAQPVLTEPEAQNV